MGREMTPKESSDIGCIGSLGESGNCWADSWFGDSKLMRHLARTHEGTLLVEGKSTYVFTLPDGRQVKGSALQQSSDWPWRDSPQVPGVRYARLRATSATYGTV